MTPELLPTLLLAIALACAALPQALVAWFEGEAGESGRFALACAAATGAALAGIAAEPDGWTGGRVLAVVLAASWVAASGMLAAHGAPGAIDRWLAWLTASAAACVVLLEVLGADAIPGSDAALRMLAPALLALLASRGAWRAWQAGDAIRTGVIASVAVAACLVAVAWPSAVASGLGPGALLALLAGAVLMDCRLAATVAREHVASRRQRDELAHASRLAIVGELTATVAHEINQPLGAILSNADAAELLLERESPPLDDIRHILADIRRDGLRASGVISHVRKLVRKRELELETLDADELARGALELLDSEARRRRLFLELAPPPAPVFVLADRSLLGQVLINLLMNAMDAVGAAEAAGAPPEGAGRAPILLAVAPTGHREVEFRVVDAGIGIPAERLDRLFDSFYTSKDHGMGLGLSISRSIVEAHGGRIFASNNPAGGATFRFTLPSAEASDAG
jgi:signal transduction histidine kinase